MIILESPVTRRIHTLFLALSLLFFCAFSLQAAETVCVKKDNVNVRTGPGMDNPVFMELFKGYPLKVLGGKGDWLNVSDYENDAGWIASELTEKRDTVIVSAGSRVNLRSQPSTKSPIVAILERGVILTRISNEGDWARVSHDSGHEGWVHKTLVWP